MIAKALGIAKATACWHCKHCWVSAISVIAKKRLVEYLQNTLVMMFPSMFRGQARESRLSLVSAPMDPF
jgi:hypothetical protein